MTWASRVGGQLKLAWNSRTTAQCRLQFVDWAFARECSSLFKIQPRVAVAVAISIRIRFQIGEPELSTLWADENFVHVF